MQVGRDRIQALLVARDEHKIVAPLGQSAGELGADARGSARHESRRHGGYPTLRTP
jgi:hypothetical protein